MQMFLLKILCFYLVPKFWDILIDYARSGRIESIDRIKQELSKSKDDLADWAKK